MDKLERVVKGLECCLYNDGLGNCKDCPYSGMPDGCDDLRRDALDLLLMQDADIKALSEKYSDLLDRMLDPITPYELEGDFWCGRGCTTVGRGKEIEWDD